MSAKEQEFLDKVFEKFNINLTKVYTPSPQFVFSKRVDRYVAIEIFDLYDEMFSL